MYDLKIVRNYAVALFENASSAKEQEELLQQLAKIAELGGKGSKTYEVMCSPIISNDIKHKGVDVVAKKLSLNKKVVTFLKILVDNARFVLISEILGHYTSLYNDANELKQAVVVSAKKMTAKEISLIESFLNKELDMKVSVENKVDDKLLGGAVIKYDSTMIDCSIKGALEQIEKVARKEH